MTSKYGRTGLHRNKVSAITVSGSGARDHLCTPGSLKFEHKQHVCPTEIVCLPSIIEIALNLARTRVGFPPALSGANLLACWRTYPEHVVRRQWPPDPLQLEFTDRLDLHGVLDLRQHWR
jgi:hypothetical protein